MRCCNSELGDLVNFVWGYGAFDLICQLKIEKFKQIKPAKPPKYLHYLHYLHYFGNMFYKSRENREKRVKNGELVNLVKNYKKKNIYIRKSKQHGGEQVNFEKTEKFTPQGKLNLREENYAFSPTPPAYDGTFDAVHSRCSRHILFDGGLA